MTQPLPYCEGTANPKPCSGSPRRVKSLAGSERILPANHGLSPRKTGAQSTHSFRPIPPIPNKTGEIAWALRLSGAFSMTNRQSPIDIPSIRGAVVHLRFPASEFWLWSCLLASCLLLLFSAPRFIAHCSAFIVSLFDATAQTYLAQRGSLLQVNQYVKRKQK